MNPTDTQIGGNHYKTAIQPVEYIHANNLNFFEGNVIKYITRHREKGGKSDLQKAIHCIEMLMQFEYPDKDETAPVEPFIVDGISEFNEEQQTLQAKIPDNTVIEKGILINGVAYPFNHNAYITEPEKYLCSCKGCIFEKIDGKCSVFHTELSAYCAQNDVIYKSLKQK